MEVKNIENWARRNRMTLNLSKTWEMLLSGGTSKTPPAPIEGTERKKWLKLLGIIFEDDVCCWDLHIDGLLSKAGSRMYILRVMQKIWISKGTSQLSFRVNYIIVVFIRY